MTITDLIAEFRTQIRDNGTAQALTDEEVIQFINDGLRTYSKYRPRKRTTMISVVVGQSTYPLPQDWITQEEETWDAAINPPPAITPMQAWTLSPFTLLSAAQLIAKPLASYERDVQYDFYPSDLQLIISPVPQMSYDLAFDYYASHTADSSSCSVPYIDIDNALLPGEIKALRSIAADYSVKLQHYKMGNNIEIDDKTVAKNLQARADELEKQLERDIIKRPSGMAG